MRVPECAEVFGSLSKDKNFKQMNNSKNLVGRNSLIISILGLITVQALIHIGYLKNEYWNILLSGFEAATIGGFADWFAVSALFREIPIPIIKKHTNIIVSNRIKLTNGVVDLVTNKWLSPEIIKEKISDIQIVKNILKTLKERQNKVKVIGFIKDIINRLTSNIDNPEVSKLLQTLLKDQLKGFDFATPLGQWVKKSIDNGDHNQLWEMILNSAEKTINNAETKTILLTAVGKQMNDYKEEGFFKRLFVGVGEKAGAIDNQSIVEKIIISINNTINEAKGNPNHPLRQKFDHNILEFAQKLINGDKDATAIIDDLKIRLVDNTDTNNIMQIVLANIKTTLAHQLNNNNTPLTKFINQNVEKLINELETDTTQQTKIDDWIKDTVENLIIKYHHEIGEMVRLSMSKLNDYELVNQIEEKVGNDLQFIRLNGAVVGGFVGMVISLIRLMLL